MFWLRVDTFIWETVLLTNETLLLRTSFRLFMNQILNILGFLLSLLLLAGLVWAAYIGLMFLVAQFELIGRSEMPVLIIASVVFIAGVMIIASAIRYYARSNDKQIHPEKAVLYTNIINAMGEAGDLGADFMDQSNQWIPHLQLWAGDEVLAAFYRLRNHLDKDGTDENEMEKLAVRLILEIRKDLGHRNRGISQKDLKLKTDARSENA
jgi:hypothetical protein